MDHVPLPTHPTTTPLRAPYVCSSNEPYDGKDFATYPDRIGWPQLLTSHTDKPFWYTSRDVVIYDEQRRNQEKALTAWMFFGVLHKLLSQLGMYNAQDYIEDDGKRWLHTKQLQATLLNWHAAITEWDASKRRALILDIAICLGLCREVLLALNGPSYVSFNPMIKAVLNALSSTVEGVILIHLPGARTLGPPMAKLDRTARQQMLRNGWCPSDICQIQRQVPTMSNLWYAQHIQKTQLIESHDDCDDVLCQRLQIDPKTYRTQHICQNQDCEHIGPDKDAIVECLRRGDIPILEVGDHITVHSLSELQHDTGYVALSHVWADGLGNPKAMQLPRCQVRRLQLLIQGIRKHTFYSGNPPNQEPIVHKQRLLLWCDTLCCPVEPELKKYALDLMRDVYDKADWVLVLSRDLDSYSYKEIGVVEAGWRITHSRWMRRLWTYQEAGLAVRLLVQFADVPVRIDTFRHEMAVMREKSPWREKVYGTILADMVLLRKWRHGLSGSAWMTNAILGMRHRSLSEASDEAVCFATVLGLDTAAVTASADRMQTLWRLICQHERSVREEVIFNTLGRMTTPGFRWAPATFLQDPSRIPDQVTVDDEGRKAVLLDRGLRVQCAGWRIRLAGTRLPEDFFAITAAGYVTLQARHSGDFYHITKTTDGMIGPQNCMLNLLKEKKEWYIILQRHATTEHMPGQSQQKGLLVSKEIHECGLSYYFSHMLVTIDRVTPSMELPRKVQFIYGQTIRTSWTMWIAGLIVVLDQTFDFPEWAIPALRSVYSWFARRIALMIKTTQSDALKQREAARLWREGGNFANEHMITGGDTLWTVLGRYVEVDEVFDTATEWVID